jgi:hypothetical protein
VQVTQNVLLPPTCFGYHHVHPQAEPEVHTQKLLNNCMQLYVILVHNFLSATYIPVSNVRPHQAFNTACVNSVETTEIV